MTETTPDAGDISTTPSEMVALLRGHILRCRTGILLLPPSQLPEALNIAARLGLDAVDYAQRVIRSVPPGAKFVPLTAESEEARMDAVAEDPLGTDVVLVYNFDLAVAKLDTRQRALLWNTLRERLPHCRRALVLAMPLGAHRLLPPEVDLAAWQGGRLAILGK